jgi:diguanylate cyclase (GGDEF)-like protein
VTPYVLVADAEAGRTATCTDLLGGLGATVRTAGSFEDAVRIVHLHGPPVLLIVDLALPGDGGLSIADVLPTSARGQTPVVAWARDRAVREYARQRLRGSSNHILSGAVRPRVLSALFARLLRRRPAEVPAEDAVTTAPELHDPVMDLSHKARAVSAAAGVAIYLRALDDAKFRASVSWTSDAAIPNIPTWLPHVFGSVLESGRPVIMPDVTIEASAPMSVLASQNGVRGLVAVPIVSGGTDIAGMICLFDVKPVALDSGQLDLLHALAGTVALRPVPVVTSAANIVERRTASGAFGLPENVLDRRGGTTAIQRELARARREQRQLSVVIFDVDPLTASPATDRSASRVIVTASRALTRGIRESDLAIRWGQEELLVVLPGLGVGEARQVAERVRAAMQAGARDASVAGGVAELLPNEPFESAVVRANAKVRLARERGHNRVA